MDTITRNNKYLIMVVEDDNILRALAVGFILDAGFDVIEVTDADKAIAILEKRNDINIIFTDINMPASIDGIKLARVVLLRWPPIHIIITSGRAPIGKNQLPSGARFFMKPYDPDHIVQAFSALASL